MDFNYRTMEYLKGLDSKLIESEYKITSIDWKKEVVCINKVDTYKKRNKKLVKVFHHFRQWVQIPKEMIKWHTVSKKGYNFHWVWADDPEYTYQAQEKYITKGEAKWIIENRNKLPQVQL